MTDRWLLAVCAGRILLYANFMVYAACLPVVQAEWGLSAAEAGSVASGFMIGYALSLVGFAWLADRFGARRMVVLSAWLSGAAAVLFGLFARSYPSALLLYSLAALAQGGSYTPLIMLFADRYPPAGRGRAVGWLIASTSIGYAGSLLVTGLALAAGGYRAAFLVTGLLPLVGAGVLAAALRGTANRIHARPPAGSLLGMLRRNRAARRLVAGYTAHCWELLGMWAWLPAFFAAGLALGGAATAEAAALASYASAGLHVVGAGAASSMGQLSDRLGRRRVLLTLAAISAAMSLVIGWLVALPLALLLLLGLVYSFSAIGDSPVLSTAITEVVEPGELGAVLALRALLGFGAGAVAPLAFGLAQDLAAPAGMPALSWGLPFAVLGLGGLLATHAAWRLAPARPPARQRRRSLPARSEPDRAWPQAADAAGQRGGQMWLAAPTNRSIRSARPARRRRRDQAPRPSCPRPAAPATRARLASASRRAHHRRVMAGSIISSCRTRRAAAGLAVGALLASGATAAQERLLRDVEPDQEELALFVLGNTLFTLHHELGHALVSELDLPIAGREEDAVDAFAAITMIPERPDRLRDQLIIAAADGWGMFSDSLLAGESPMWGEHSLDAQRYYATVCLMVGSDPDGFRDYATEAELPDERIAACPDDYRRARTSWARLLAPHRKRPGEGRPGGALRVRFERPGPLEDGLDALAQADGLIERALADLSAEIALPRDLVVRFQDCPGPDAYWRTDRGEVVICYQLLAEFERLLLHGQRF
jgi:MFS family permease